MQVFLFKNPSSPDLIVVNAILFTVGKPTVPPTYMLIDVMR